MSSIAPINQQQISYQLPPSALTMEGEEKRARNKPQDNRTAKKFLIVPGEAWQGVANCLDPLALAQLSILCTQTYKITRLLCFQEKIFDFQKKHYISKIDQLNVFIRTRGLCTQDIYQVFFSALTPNLQRAITKQMLNSARECT